jgi:hypothetical protein
MKCKNQANRSARINGSVTSRENPMGNPIVGRMRVGILFQFYLYHIERNYF